MNPVIVSSLGFSNWDAYKITELGNIGTAIGPVINMNVKFDVNPNQQTTFPIHVGVMYEITTAVNKRIG